jgi:hypothetical protein
MRHYASPRFWQHYHRLPAHIRRLANKNFELLKQNPKHPSLHLKRIGRFWSVRVGLNHRALAIEGAKGPIWFWIGTHDEYDKPLKGY